MDPRYIKEQEAYHDLLEAIGASSKTRYCTDPECPDPQCRSLRAAVAYARAHAEAHQARIEHDGTNLLNALLHHADDGCLCEHVRSVCRSSGSPVQDCIACRARAKLTEIKEAS